MEAKVNAAGVAISGDSGTTSHEGATVRWAYDGTTLSITVLSAPMFCEKIVEKKIADAVNGALNG
jgi:hypothetical protein